MELQRVTPEVPASASLAHFRHTPSALEIEEQTHWEMHAVSEGVARYRTLASVADPATLPPGRRVLRLVVPLLAARIEATQAKQDEARAGPTGNFAALYRDTIQLLDPEKAAVLAVSTCLRTGGGGDLSFTSLAKSLGGRLKDQVEHDRWAAEQAAEGTPAKKAIDRIRRRYPRMRWDRIAQRLEGFQREPWSPEVTVATGAAVLGEAVEAGQEWWSVAVVNRPTGSMRVLRLTSTAEEVLRDLEERAEVAFPPRLPMLIRPNPWRYE